MTAPKFAIGTAQFGMKYGIAGLSKVSKTEAKKILSLCALNNIDVIDTAHQYGNAIEVLGHCSKLIKNYDFRIILKIPDIPEGINLWKIQSIRDLIFRDLAILKVDNVDTLMIHNANCLLRSGADVVVDMLLNLKFLGFCENIGVSVYDPSEIKLILANYPFDVISFPTNILDQRFVNSSVEYMSTLGYEMHARSLFLQGLLLLPNKPMLNKLSWDFKRVIRLISIAFEGDMLKACLAFFRQQFPIHYGVIGVHSVDQLQQIITAYNNIDSWYNFEKYALHDLRVIDPRKWSNGT